MIEIIHVSKSFDSIKAVDNIDLEINDEIFGLLGPNGAGKTTAIKIMAGLLCPDEGNIRIGGQDIQKKPLAAKKQFGLVLEEPYLFARLTPFEFLILIGKLYGMAKSDIQDRIAYLFQLFELEGHAHKLISTLSHGTRQKVALGGGLIHGPSILILDEPLTGLDPRSVYILKQELRNIAQNGGSILIATHILEVAQGLCDRVGIINQGKLIACGDLAALRREASISSDHLEDIFLRLTESGRQNKSIDSSS